MILRVSIPVKSGAGRGSEGDVESSPTSEPWRSCQWWNSANGSILTPCSRKQASRDAISGVRACWAPSTPAELKSLCAIRSTPGSSLKRWTEPPIARLAKSYVFVHGGGTPRRTGSNTLKSKKNMLLMAGSRSALIETPPLLVFSMIHQSARSEFPRGSRFGAETHPRRWKSFAGTTWPTRRSRRSFSVTAPEAIAETLADFLNGLHKDAAKTIVKSMCDEVVHDLVIEP